MRSLSNGNQTASERVIHLLLGRSTSAIVEIFKLLGAVVGDWVRSSRPPAVCVTWVSSQEPLANATWNEPATYVI